MQQQLEKVAEKAAEVADPFEQSLFLLAHVSYLQAFADVNKRTARLSANIPLITKNLVPLSFNDVEVEDYMSTMIAIYELQDVRPLVDLYVYSYMRTCAAYDSTVKALGFDEVRVRYRLQRREVLRVIILKKASGTELDEYIKFQANKDVHEDLEQIDENRLAGLGVTPEQLKEWLQM